jgi:nucleoid DNA-binding protein
MTISDAQWEIAHAIALTLVKDNTDVNELGKAVAYLRGYVHQPDATSRFFKYLKTLVSNGRQIGHSKKTTDYYISIDKACSDYLKNISEPHTILQILGWVSRLMRYYKDAGIPIGEIATSTAPNVESARQAEIAKVAKSQDFQVDQILDAVVTKINGNKVTYEILGTIKLTEKEPKKAASIHEGQTVQVKIVSLKDDKSIKSVKFID